MPKISLPTAHTINPQPRARDERGRFLEVDGEKQVRDVASFQSRAPELIAQFGDMTVSGLRELFGGKSVTQIRKMSAPARAQLIAGQLGFQGFNDVGAIAATLGAEFGFAPSHGASLAGDKTANFSGSARPMFTIGTMSYDDPGVTAFLDEAFALDRGGAPGKALEIYDMVLGEHPQNPDALNRKGLALKHRGQTAVDDTSPANDSNNTRRGAVRDLESALAHFEQVVDLGTKAGVYDPATNELTLPNLKKFRGNEDVRHLFAAVPKALYNIASTRVALAKLQGGDQFADQNLAALKTATSISTNLTDPDVASKLLRESSRFERGGQATLHNRKLEGTLKDAAAFAANVGAKFSDGFKKDGDFSDMHRASGFANAIRQND